MHKKMMKLTFWLTALLTLFFYCKPAHAVDAGNNVPQPPKQPVLLVYDSKNAAEHDENNIDSLQRLFVSLNLPIKTMSMAQYQPGTLKDQNYSAVVLMVNWPEAHLIKNSFVKDLENFHGKILHVGPSLTAVEKQQLQGNIQYLRHKQYFLYDKSNKYYQMLDFINSSEFVTKPAAGSQVIGQLTSQDYQDKMSHKFIPYGVIHNNIAFLPYFRSDGLSFLEASELIAQFFCRQTQSYRPLLVITGITPYSDLRRLVKVAEYLYSEGIPYAISATSVATNTNLKAYHYYTLALQHVENNGGEIFLQVPSIYAPDTAKTAYTTLRNDMTQTLTALRDNYVYPIGISAPAYWNQDELYRSAALSLSNQILLTSDPDENPLPYAQEDNYGETYGRTYYAMTASSLNTIKEGNDLDSQDDLRFSTPTAVTVPLPTSSKSFLQFKRNIKTVNLQWANPDYGDFKSCVQAGNKQISFLHGNYLVDNNLMEVPLTAAKIAADGKAQVPHGTLSGFFNVQGIILEVFIIIALIILVVLFVLGYRVYVGMFKYTNKRHKTTLGTLRKLSKKKRKEHK